MKEIKKEKEDDCSNMESSLWVNSRSSRRTAATCSSSDDTKTTTMPTTPTTMPPPTTPTPSSSFSSFSGWVSFEKMKNDIHPEANFYDSDIVASFSLTAEDLEVAESVVAANRTLLPQFTRDKLERDAVRNWDIFYKHNQANFFKDRQWIKKEFREMSLDFSSSSSSSSPCIEEGEGEIAEIKSLQMQEEKKKSLVSNRPESRRLLVDIGCGVGNALIPILENFPNLRAVGVDCSVRAINLLQERWKARVEEKKRQRRERKLKQSEASKSPSSSSTPSTSSTTLTSPSPTRLSSPSSSSSASAGCPSSLDRGCREEEGEVSLVRKTEGKEEEREGGETGHTPTVHEEHQILDQEEEEEIDGEEEEEDEDVDSCGSEPDNDGREEEEEILTAEPFDITKGCLPPSLCLPERADFVLLLFVLSALHPRHHLPVVLRCASLLKPGGILFFRDYGRYDLSQLRFAKKGKSKVAENTYARHDGTLACYFLTDELRELFCRQAGLEELENRYCLREFRNRKTGVRMRRIWIQAKFQKPTKKEKEKKEEKEKEEKEKEEKEESHQEK